MIAVRKHGLVAGSTAQSEWPIWLDDLVLDLLKSVDGFSGRLEYDVAYACGEAEYEEDDPLHRVQILLLTHTRQVVRLDIEAISNCFQCVSNSTHLVCDKTRDAVIVVDGGELGVVDGEINVEIRIRDGEVIG